MCHYITAVLPASANAEALAPIMEKYGRQLRPQPNSSIEEQLRAGERYFFTTRGPCDCGTALGALVGAEKSIEQRKEAVEKEEQKLRRKGWSQAKLERWRTQKQGHRARPRRSDEPTEWVALVNDILNSRHTSSFGLLLHWYNGPLEGRIQLSARNVVKLVQVSPELLGRMQEDVLYEFRV